MINKDRLIQSFIEYVTINSESRDEKAFSEVLTKKLKELGFTVTQFDKHDETGSEAGNIYAYLPGNKDIEPILFSAHMDTVSPGKGIIPCMDDGCIKSKGDTILGGDDKAGICAILESAASIQEQKATHGPIEIVFSVCEEAGLLGAKTMDVSYIKSRQAVIVDTGGPAGKIITSAPGQMKLNAVIHGIAAHAGNAPEKGVSAIMAAADAVVNMKLLRIDEETTANIGTFLAEGATNIVAPKAQLIMEARSRSKEKLREQMDHMILCLKNSAEKFGAEVDYTVEESYQPFKLGKNEKLTEKIRECCKKIQLHYTLEASGGGSDANVYNKFGITSVNLANGTENVHTVNEKLNMSDFIKCAELLYEIMIY